MIKMIRNEKGFTLVELLIVVIILGILAAVIIPQFGSSTDDAKLAALDSSLSSMRNGVELYYHEHGAVYPGEKHQTTGAAVANATECSAAFTAQMTLYSETTGITANTKTATSKGPYIKDVKLPINPYTNTNTVLCDNVETDITVAASSGTAAWKFYAKTGRFIANDGAHDTN